LKQENDAHHTDLQAGKARSWHQVLSSYRTPSSGRALWEIAITVGPLLALWTLMWAATGVSYWLTLVLAVPTAGFLVRLFMIQHDCGHGSFFPNRSANDWTGRVLGVLTLTPYGFWRRTHAIHHAGSGNLDRRGHGDLHTLTVSEYRNSTKWQKFCYRAYRHPLILFGIGPAYLFFVQHRLPVGLMDEGWQPWISTMGTNAAIVTVAALAILCIGLKAFLLVYLPVTLIAGSIGVWLFFVQHQFERTTWEHDATWDWHDAALRGSSYYDLPAVLRWLTANIGMHHIHHLCSRIPYYRLRSVLRDHPQLARVSRLSLADSLRCGWLALWDERRGRLVTFREAHAAAA